MANCLECGEDTGNPKFCGKSCAAKFNNKMHPKRQPENICPSCGIKIPTRYRLCESCRKKEEEENNKRRDGVKSFRTIEGVPIERCLPDVRYYSKIVFELHKYEKTITIENKIADLIDLLIGAVFSEPPFLRKNDINRYVELLDSFSRHETSHYNTKTKFITGELPVAELEGCLHSWIDSILHNKDAHPLMVTYAIDAALLIKKLTVGYHLYPIGNKHPAMIEPFLDDRGIKYFGSERLFGPKFKKEVTEYNIGRKIVLLSIPIGCYVCNLQDEKIFDECTELLFRIERCHISSAIYDYTTSKIYDNKAIDYDLSEDFEFDGEVLLENNNPDLSIASLCGDKNEKIKEIIWSQKRPENMMKLPIRWITHAVKLGNHNENIQILPIPKWDF